MANRRRGFETLGDLARSLGLVLAAVFVIILVTLRTDGQRVRVVDYEQVLRQAAPVAPFALVDPAGLGDGWRATSVYYEPPARTGRTGEVLWHVGFLTPGERYAAFEQTNGAADDVLRRQLGPLRRTVGTSAVDGVTWARWQSADDQRRAIERTAGGVTVVVHGSADWVDLERLAVALRTG